MDEVDNIIIHSLLQIGCSEVENLKLQELTPEILVKSVSKCISLIDPTLDVPKSLPPGMAQRFTVTASLAENCVQLGFRGDIGYQTFLYSNVSEVRKLFMYLIERLPKEAEKVVVVPQKFDDFTILSNQIIEKLRNQSKEPRVLEYCDLNRIRRKFPAREFHHDFPGKRLNITRGASSVHDQTSPKNLILSLLHTNDFDFEYPETSAQSSADVMNKISLTSEAVGVRGPINFKSLGSGAYPPISDETQAEAIDNQSIVQSPVEKLSCETETLRRTTESLITDHQTLVEQISTIRLNKDHEEVVLSKLRSEKKIQEGINILLENPEESVVKIESIISTTIERKKLLAEQWSEHQRMLNDALEQAKAKYSKEFEFVTEMEAEIEKTEQKVQDCKTDYRAKQQHHSQLVEELTRISKRISRQSYTSRILEIIGNIKKQKTSIDKILVDTKELQKEINNLTGKLERQFTVTDDLIFKTAKRNDSSKKAYKFLVTLHSDCELIINFVQEIGTIMREVRDLDDQIEMIKAGNVSANLERISDDLQHIENDSQTIEGRIAKIRNS